MWPQESIQGPNIYILYTAAILETANTTVTTFIDDTAILPSHKGPIVASGNLQL